MRRTSPCSIDVLTDRLLWNLATGLPARLHVLLLRVVAWFGVESSSTESCDTDVEDVLVDELEGPVDQSRNDKHVILRVASYVPAFQK